jgi:hypothetical protein
LPSLYIHPLLQLEYVLVLLSRAPPSNFSKSLESKAIGLLYYDLPHPPSTHMGQRYSFRSADGSGNSSLDPEMGKSFTPYSRSCTSTHPLPQSELPEAGLVFDMLIRRDKVCIIRPMPFLVLVLVFALVLVARFVGAGVQV